MGVAKGQLFFLGVVMVGGSLNEWVGLSIDVHLRSFMAQVGLRVGIEGAGRPDRSPNWFVAELSPKL